MLFALQPEAASVLAIVSASALYKLVFWVLSLEIMLPASQRRVRQLNRDIYAWKEQLKTISAMDELARYCKIERKISRAEKEISQLEPSQGVFDILTMVRDKAMSTAVQYGTRALLMAVVTFLFSDQRFQVPEFLPSPVALILGPGPYSAAVWFPLCFGALAAVSS